MVYCLQCFGAWQVGNNSIALRDLDVRSVPGSSSGATLCKTGYRQWWCYMGHAQAGVALALQFCHMYAWLDVEPHGRMLGSITS